MEIVLDKEVVVKGRVLGFERLTVQLPDGRQTGREIIRHPGGCVIIPVDKEKNVYLVRQYRVAIGSETIELPAGKLEKGEEPLSCAKRELFEETGIKAGKITFVTSIYPSPGYSSELLHIFLAEDIEVGEASPDDGEFVEAFKAPMRGLLDNVLEGRIRDAKTVIGLLLADRIIGGGSVAEADVH